MKLQNLKKAVLISFITTLILTVVLFALTIIDPVLVWPVAFGVHTSEFFTELGKLLAFSAGYTDKSIATLVLLVAILAIIVGWIIWIVKTKRYIEVAYISLLVLLTGLILHYVVFFDSHYAVALANFSVTAIIITILIVLTIISMILLATYALLLDFYLTNDSVEESEEVRKIVLTTEDNTTTSTTTVFVEETVVIVKEKDYVEVDSKKEKPVKPVVQGAFGARKPREPFALKLKKSDQSLKDIYNEIKAEFLSYGLGSRISLNGDTFRLHTKTYARIQVVGKSLKINYALNTKDYTDSTIPHTDSGHQKAYEEIPFTFKVRSSLSVRRAKDLIRDSVINDGLTQDEVINKNYAKETIATLNDSNYYKNNF